MTRHEPIFWPAGAPTRIDSGGAGDGTPRVDRDDLNGGTARNLEFQGGPSLRLKSTGEGHRCHAEWARRFPPPSDLPARRPAPGTDRARSNRATALGSDRVRNVRTSVSTDRHGARDAWGRTTSQSLVNA